MFADADSRRDKVKNLAPLRSSDRRKITDQIIQDYEIEIPKTEPAEPQAVQTEEHASNSGIGSIRNSLLPEGALWAKFTTTTGKDLKTVTGSIYVGAYTDGEQRVLWLKLDERLIPTGM